jgi:hypothetical protein
MANEKLPIEHFDTRLALELEDRMEFSNWGVCLCAASHGSSCSCTVSSHSTTSSTTTSTTGSTTGDTTTPA